MLSDRLHPGKAIIIVLVPFMISMAMIPLSTGLPLIAFLLLLSIWGALSWTVTPVQNSLIIKTSPETSEILISTNSGIAHAGIALGTYIGGLVIDHSSIVNTGWVGSILVCIGLGSAVLAISMKKNMLMRSHEHTMIHNCNSNRTSVFPAFCGSTEVLLN